METSKDSLVNLTRAIEKSKRIWRSSTQNNPKLLVDDQLQSNAMSSESGKGGVIDPETKLVFENEEEMHLHRACEVVRARLTAAFLFANQAALSPHAAIENTGTLQRLNGGVTFMNFGEASVIQIPTTYEKTHRNSVIASLFKVYDEYKNSRDWIIDLSATESIPVSIIWELLAYKSTLEAEGKKFFVVWCTPKSMEPTVFAKVSEKFGLVERLGHYFSKGLLPDVIQ